MATIQSKLLVKEMEWMANMTEQSHLGRGLIAKPHRLIGEMDKLFSSENYYSDNAISSLLMGKPLTEETIAGTEWEWELKGANTRPLVVVENVEPTSNTTPGKFRKTFRIKLDENWYLPGDVLTPGNPRYQVRIQNQGVKQGDGVVYTVRYNSDDPQAFLPIKYLKPGQQWGKLFSQYEEAAEQSGSTQFSAPIAFRNRMSKYRKEYRITDYAATEVLAVAIPDSNGKYHNMWMKYAEVEYWKQWYREIERGIWYSRSADTVIGANGRPVRMGPGIQEQLEDSNVEYYTHLTAKLIEEYLQDIFYSRVKPGKGRSNVKGFTGEYGMLQFHRAIQDWQQKSGFVKNVEIFTNKVSSDLHKNALEAGYQFVRYNMANGASLELIHNPLYDDREINSEIDEVTGFPLESQRITFLDFVGEGRSSNIKIMNKKDSFSFTYVCGTQGPYGPTNGGMSAHSGDYYEMHVGRSLGVHIHDVTRCGELILARN